MQKLSHGFFPRKQSSYLNVSVRDGRILAVHVSNGLGDLIDDFQYDIWIDRCAHTIDERSTLAQFRHQQIFSIRFRIRSCVGALIGPPNKD